MCLGSGLWGFRVQGLGIEGLGFRGLGPQGSQFGLWVLLRAFYGDPKY